jgi:hypothetical protein
MDKMGRRLKGMAMEVRVPRCEADDDAGPPVAGDAIVGQVVQKLVLEAAPPQAARQRQQRAGWTAKWPVTRTLAASLVRYGSPAALVDFAEYGLADEPGRAANLNYWAYWLGEMTAIEPDDSFMPARPGPWRGDRVMRHLASRLDAEAGVADLMILTISVLLAARPRLLGEDPSLTAGLAGTAERVLDGGRMSSTARQALAQVCYALRLHTR